RLDGGKQGLARRLHRGRGLRLSGRPLSSGPADQPPRHARRSGAHERRSDRATGSRIRAASSRFWGVARGLAAGALWGLVFLAPKMVPEASPLLLTAGRYLAYGLIAVLLIAPRWRRVTAALTREAWGALV